MKKNVSFIFLLLLCGFFFSGLHAYDKCVYIDALKEIVRLVVEPNEVADINGYIQASDAGMVFSYNQEFFILEYAYDLVEKYHEKIDSESCLQSIVGALDSHFAAVETGNVHLVRKKKNVEKLVLENSDGVADIVLFPHEVEIVESLRVAGTTHLVGDAALDGDLRVAGTLNLSGQLALNDLVVGGDLIVNKDKFIIDGKTGSARTTGELVVDAGSGKSALTVTGLMSLKSTGTALTVYGSAQKTVGGTTWINASDRRIKENIIDADLGECLDLVNCVNLKKFSYTSDWQKATGVSQEAEWGIIAQELEEVLPNSVVTQECHVLYDMQTGDEINRLDDFKTYSFDQISKLSVGAIQQLARYVVLLQAKCDDLQERVSRLEGR